jgi:nicotinate-nucleotide adenylyltransferase
MKLGIMGGTFDPIHFGHLLIAHEAGWRLGLDKVLIMPTGDPPHKRDHAITPARHRLEMVKLAIEHNPLFEASDLEVNRPGLTYTAVTLEALREMYPPEVEFYFILGFDAAADLPGWQRPERILELAKLVVAERPNYVFPREKLQEAFPHINLDERLLELDVPMFEVASHELRERIAKGQPVRYLVPSRVVEYINREKLYGDKGAIL